MAAIGVVPKSAAAAPPLGHRLAKIPPQIAKMLKSAVDRRALYIMVGSGVTLNVTRLSDGTAERFGVRPELTCDGFIVNGLQQVEDRYQDQKAACDHHRTAIKEKYTNASFSAAQYIHSHLDEGAYATWLEDTFASVPEKVTDDRVLRVLHALTQRGVKIMTTNYDSLIEKCVYTSADPVDGKDDVNVIHFMDSARDDHSVYHVHGHYRNPKNVVIDFMQYERARNNDWLNAHLRSTLLRDHVLFIGCGLPGGLTDFHFQPLWDALDVSGPSQTRHVCLLSKKESMPKHRHLQVLEYGDDVNNDLALYLKHVFDLSDVECRGAVTSDSPFRQAQEDQVGRAVQEDAVLQHVNNGQKE
jgi:hypothetical protein